MVEELVVLFLPLLAAIIISALLWLISKSILSKIPLPNPVQASILAVIQGPISAVIIGFATLEAITQVDSTYPNILPVFLSPANAALIVQLAVLGISLRVAVSDIRLLTPLISQERPVGRVLYLSIYALGLITLSHILLSATLAPRIVLSIQTIASFVAGIIITYLVVYASDVIIRRYVHALVEKELRLQTIYTFIRRLALVAVALIGVSATTFITFPAAGAAVASIFIAAGFSSIVIGLAAQSSISNIISGMLISVTQPFRIGDAVMFKKEFCYVEDIKLVHTVLRTWDNRRLLVPNSLFQSEVVANYTAGDPSMLLPISVQVSYESDLDKAMKIMREVAQRHPDFMPLADLPKVMVMSFGNSGINLRLLSRARDQTIAFLMARDLLYLIKKEFDSNGIEIPYPRRHLVLDRTTEQFLSKSAGGQSASAPQTDNPPS